MNNDIDVSIQLAGLRFKSPVIVSSSECGSDLSQVKILTKMNIGGIVTKTFTTPGEFRIRVRPYQFPLNKFGRGFKESGSLYSLAAPHVEERDQILDKVSMMAGICRKSSVVLIVSFFEDPTNVPNWVKQAKAFEEAGADMIELNFSSPSAVNVFSKSFRQAGAIISEIKKYTSIPIGMKISPTIEPLESFVSIGNNAGIDFITAHNAPSGIIIDVENEVPFGAPTIGGYVMGRTFLPYSLGRIVRIRKSSDIPIIGVGGIYRTDDALQYLLCGCPLVGIGSALYFRGFKVVDKIHSGIIQWMRNKGYQNIDEFKGKAYNFIKDGISLKSEEKYPHVVPPDCPYVPVIKSEKCNLCGRCAETCIYKVIKIDKEKSLINIDDNKCWSCGFCVGICPSSAITLVERANREKIIWNNEGLAETFK